MKRSPNPSRTKRQQTSQNYSFSHSSVGGQSSSDSFTVTDTRQFNENLNQTTTFDRERQQCKLRRDDVVQQSVGVRLPAAVHDFGRGLSDGVRQALRSGERPASTKSRSSKCGPADFFQHFFIPLSADLTVGEYSQPSGEGQPESLATWRGDANVVGGTPPRKRFSEAIFKAPLRSTSTPTAPVTSRPRWSKT